MKNKILFILTISILALAMGSWSLIKRDFKETQEALSNRLYEMDSIPKPRVPFVDINSVERLVEATEVVGTWYYAR